MEIEAPVDITRVDPIDDDVDTDPSPIGEASWLRRGQTISRYVIVECLGVGGMGIVYAAWDPKLDRKLAIKLVRARLGASGGTRGRNRLMREAQALACVRHPNVVTVHDVGTHEGRVFVAMEFIEGTTLQQWLEQQRERPFAELLEVFLQAGRGLAAAHRAGLVHRDFKPENVMIGSDGRVVVLDFGIARGPTLVEDPPNADVPVTKVEDAEEAEESAGEESEPEQPQLAPSELIEDGMTRPGAIVGTPSYMSPEQRRRRPLDRRSDQFSYCVALWEALSGERPFGEAPAQKLLARMRLGQFRPMHRRGVPRRVIQALHRGLAWDRNDRFPTMEALLEALNPRARPPARLPLALIGGVLAIVATVAGMIVGSRTQQEAEPPPPNCTSDPTRIAELWHPARAEQIAEQVDSTWPRSREQIDAWTRRWLSVRTATCEQHVELALADQPHDLRVACLDRQLDRFAVVIASLAAPSPIGRRETEGVIAVIAELPDPELCSDDVALREQLPDPESAPERERLAELRAEADRLEVLSLLSDDPLDIEPIRHLVASARALGHLPLQARALLLLGNHLERSGASEEAERVLLEAGRRATSAREFEIAAEAIDGLARLLGARGLHDEALRWLELAEGLAEQVGDPQDLRVSFANTRATIASDRGDWATAAAGFERARMLLESDDERDLDASSQLALARVRNQLGLLHDWSGRCTQARELLDAGLATIAIAAPEGIEHAKLLSSRASVCDYADASALEQIDHAAAIHERLADPDRSADRIDRSLALLARARFDDALAELEPVRELEAELQPTPRARLDAATGLILQALGRDAEARMVLIRAAPDLPSGTPLARRVANAIADLPAASE